MELLGHMNVGDCFALYSDGPESRWFMIIERYGKVCVSVEPSGKISRFGVAMQAAHTISQSLFITAERIQERARKDRKTAAPNYPGSIDPWS